jgi:nucleoside-diphosphate-sugar epimerase
MDIALLVRRVVSEELPGRGNLEIVTTPTDDIRSYHINSDKVTRILGFKPKYTIEDAVRELCQAFDRGSLPDSFSDDMYFNVKRLQRLKAA